MSIKMPLLSCYHFLVESILLLTHFTLLKQFAKLRRNALVHERLQANTYIATPNDDVVL